MFKGKLRLEIFYKLGLYEGKRMPMFLEFCIMTLSEEYFLLILKEALEAKEISEAKQFVKRNMFSYIDKHND